LRDQVSFFNRIDTLISLKGQLHTLKRQIHFVASTKRQVLVGLILCIYLSFIVIVLQPFDTSQFEDEHKTNQAHDKNNGAEQHHISLVKGKV